MPQHRPTWVPAIFALLSIATSCAASARAVHAAPCIAKPNAPPPQGEHWYYRTDRATKRQCWYLGPEDANIQGATRASYQPAADVLVQPVAPQRAQQSTALALTAAPATTEANVPAPAAPPPWPEAAKLPDAPPTFAPPPTPALAERQQSVDAIELRAEASERSCQGVAIARNRTIFTRLCARGVHGRCRSHFSAGDDRVRGDCYFRLGVRGHALAASAQGPQSSRIRMGNFEHTIPTCPGVSRLQFKDTGTTHSTD